VLAHEERSAYAGKLGGTAGIPVPMDDGIHWGGFYFTNTKNY
jgi:hypothetical protein